MPVAITIEQAKDALGTFNGKLEKILHYSFFQRAKISIAGHHDFTTHTVTVDSDYPGDEAIDAVILNLRFFTLEGEFSSHRKIKSVYAALNPSPEIQKEFSEAYNKWTAWNQQPSGIRETTNAELFKIVFYGERAHRNCPATYKVYDKWKADALLFETAMTKFCWKVIELVGILRDVRAVNVKILS